MPDSSLAADAESLKTWWKALLDDEPPTAVTCALWFRLFEAEDGTTFYVQGYPDFDVTDETAEWASSEPSWAPEGRYLRLASITEAETWRHALDTCLRLLQELQPWDPWPGSLAGVAAGFDDGDAHLIWTRSG